MTINFGTFLLMQSPSARSSQEIYARGLEIAQAAESLGFGNVWLAEHHFSTYGYLSRPVQLATYIAAKTSRIRVGTAVIVVPLHHPLVIAEEIATLDLLAGGRLDVGLGRGYQPYECERVGSRRPGPSGRRPARRRSRARLSAVRVRALRARARERPRALGRVDRYSLEELRCAAVQLRRQAVQDPGNDGVPADAPETAPADLDHGAEPRVGRSRCAPRLQCPDGRLRRAHRAHGRVPPAVRPPGQR